MKHFNLLKTSLLLCALIVGSLSGWATDVTFTFNTDAGIAELGIAKPDKSAASNLSTEPYSKSGVTLTATHGSTNTRVWNSNGVLDLRIYKSGGSLTFTAPANITRIVISGSAVTNFSANVGTFSAGTWTGDASSVTLSATNTGKINTITVSYTVSGTTEAPSINGNADFLESTTISIANAASADGASIYYTLDGSEPTTTTSETCFAYSAPFTVNATTTVKAIAKKSTDSNASSIVSKTFTKVIPKTVAEAITAIDVASPAQVNGVYVKGIISKIDTYSENKYITYWISDDGLTTNQFEVYKGLGINGAAFSGKSDLEVGDEVVIYGNMKKYSGTYEFVQDNQIFNMIHKTAPSFALDVTEKTLDAYTHETVDVTLTTNTDGDVTCESSNPDVATVALKSAGVYTITAQSEGSATITIKAATTATYKPASATVAITVEDGRADASISFAETDIEKTWGESFTGQALTNTNSVDVTYSSTDESVATVSSTGVVTVLKAGSTTIKATFAGNATYKASVASYDLTINKAEAGLSFVETEFDVDLNDDSFVAPTLNNPNSLTVTYTSNNDNVAVVDDNTGELLLKTSAEGTVTITATFAGNDNFKSGNATYTITITDPNRKGTKKNPYTVAEVKNGTATGSGIYVVGYIVGNYNSKNPVNPATADTNLALADNADETTGSNTIPVELQDKGSLREDWGPKSNNLIGYKVLIKGNKDTYFSTNGIKKVTEISAVSVPVSVSAAGWATYCSSNALDFTGVTALTAYTASKDGDVVKFNKVTGKVPANTGLLVRGETANVPVCASADPVTNLLEGVTAETVKTANTVFVLMKGSKGIGFYKNTNAFTLRANSAYLRAEDVPTTDARAFIALDDETTGIADVKAVKEDAEGMFDLQGRKIAKPTKGLYIVNGKKVVVK